MTKKDYELIAGVLNYGIESKELSPRITKILADKLAQDNPRFDRDKFLPDYPKDNQCICGD
jgi:hypothetical protein